jgi:glucose-1-phosphate adenylyltransferase
MSPLRRVCDKRCRLPDRLNAGVDPEADRKRFHVTERGVTVIVARGRPTVHHLR